MKWEGEGMLVSSAAAVDSYSGDSLPPWERRTSFEVVLQPTGDKSPVTAEIDRAFKEIEESVTAETGMEPDGGCREEAEFLEGMERGAWGSLAEGHGPRLAPDARPQGKRIPPGVSGDGKMG